MLMASHRQGAFPLEASDSHQGHQPGSYWEALGMKFYPLVVGERKRRESYGKVTSFLFSFFVPLTTTSFLHSLGTKFLFWLNGKSPWNKSWWGRFLSEVPSVTFHQVFLPSPLPIPLYSFLSALSDPASSISICCQLKRHSAPYSRHRLRVVGRSGLCGVSGMGPWAQVLTMVGRQGGRLEAA